MKQRLTNKLKQIQKDQEDLNENYLFLKQLISQFWQEISEDTKQKLSQLKFSTLEILKDILLRWKEDTPAKYMGSESKTDNMGSTTNTPFGTAQKTKLSEADYGNEDSMMKTGRTQITEIYNKMKTDNLSDQIEQLTRELLKKESEIDDLHTMLIKQKEENRKFVLKNYNSDLSVNTADKEVKDPDALEEKVQEMRREKDRLEHEHLGLQHDVQEMESERDKILRDIEDHENHLVQLKGKFEE